ncbi:hypothetical protein BKA61DRAFT_578197 [Leptodontidium sp. MPI-SDFR-AT-0119]|nr:hypothetical protein BKA61DRAFT_578197 [Leptodontidium sp. MPI-SDFR-AT-0119]
MYQQVAQKFELQGINSLNLKSRNIMSGYRDATRGHLHTPIIKIGDFSLSEFIQEGNIATVTVPGTFIAYEDMRRLGTRGYSAPEQFTPRWNFSDYATSPVCGKYGTVTNVWGIGCIILVCWDQGTPEPHLPFLATHPNLTIHGALGRGILFGTHLQGTAYSKISETQFMSVYRVMASSSS